MFVGHINYARFWRGIRINLFLPSWCFNGSPDDMTYCLECAVASILQEIDETLCNEKFFPPVWSMRETVALFWISHKHFYDNELSNIKCDCIVKRCYSRYFKPTVKHSTTASNSSDSRVYRAWTRLTLSQTFINSERGMWLLSQLTTVTLIQT